MRVREELKISFGVERVAESGGIGAGNDAVSAEVKVADSAIEVGANPDFAIIAFEWILFVHKIQCVLRVTKVVC
ncbi:hypothetical protein IEQ34_001279 [Dendrobium chrysotoxum]|uniref:Uncharacterized protein n=1 Tax=Dendrobium chrysotoxum TaxID=161865 RepID=A0AAV7HL81_DENCH|nr:hypothetical protein IEQ34_001279 [Dendrobium chrysotoxum]